MCKGDGKRTVDEGIYEAATSSPVIAEDLKIHNKEKEQYQKVLKPFPYKALIQKNEGKKTDLKKKFSWCKSKGLYDSAKMVFI